MQQWQSYYEYQVVTQNTTNSRTSHSPNIKDNCSSHFDPNTIFINPLNLILLN